MDLNTSMQVYHMNLEAIIAEVEAQEDLTLMSDDHYTFC